MITRFTAPGGGAPRALLGNQSVVVSAAALDSDASFRKLRRELDGEMRNDIESSSQ
jgi:hypothetical protein